MICVSVSATKSYLYAFPQCLRAIATAAAHHREGHFVFCTDESPEAEVASKLAENLLPEGWKITTLKFNLPEDEKDYKRTAQLRIALLQGSAFAFAKAKVRPTMFWNVESDNIVPPHALKTLEWALQMPALHGGPLYDIAAGTYVNGLFLGGFGTPQNPIARDFKPHERKLPRWLKLCYEECEKRLKACKDQKTANKEIARMSRLWKYIDRHGADGSIWEVIAKYGWHRRGWFDFAYPGIGEGAIVPVDWCGLGCTLLSERALAVADFLGYDGGGTQDLYLCWHRWYPARLRITTVPHVLCGHVKSEDGKLVYYRPYHEVEGEFRGHLRFQRQDWIPI